MKKIVKIESIIPGDWLNTGTRVEEKSLQRLSFMLMMGKVVTQSKYPTPDWEHGNQRKFMRKDDEFRFKYFEIEAWVGSSVCRYPLNIWKFRPAINQSSLETASPTIPQSQRLLRFQRRGSTGA